MPEIVGVKDVTVALPHLIGGEGIIATLSPPLNEEETQALEKSARLIKSIIDQLLATEGV